MLCFASQPAGCPRPTPSGACGSGDGLYGRESIFKKVHTNDFCGKYFYRVESGPAKNALTRCRWVYEGGGKQRARDRALRQLPERVIANGKSLAKFRTRCFFPFPSEESPVIVRPVSVVDRPTIIVRSASIRSRAFLHRGCERPGSSSPRRWHPCSISETSSYWRGPLNSLVDQESRSRGDHNSLL